MQSVEFQRYGNGENCFVVNLLIDGSNIEGLNAFWSENLTILKVFFLIENFIIGIFKRLSLLIQNAKQITQADANRMNFFFIKILFIIKSPKMLVL